MLCPKNHGHVTEENVKICVTAIFKKTSYCTLKIGEEDMFWFSEKKQ